MLIRNNINCGTGSAAREGMISFPDLSCGNTSRLPGTTCSWVENQSTGVGLGKELTGRFGRAFHPCASRHELNFSCVERQLFLRSECPICL